MIEKCSICDKDHDISKYVFGGCSRHSGNIFCDACAFSGKLTKCDSEECLRYLIINPQWIVNMMTTLEKDDKHF